MVFSSFRFQVLLLPCVIGLFEWDPVSVGHERAVELPDGRLVTLRTLSVDPPIFSVPKLFSIEEADQLVESASQFLEGISEIKGSNGEDTRMLKAGGAQARNVLHDFAREDRTRTRLFPSDIAFLGGDLFGMPNHNHSEFLAELDLKGSASKGVPVQDLVRRSAQLVDYYERIVAEKPERRSRYSEQSWLPHSEVELLLQRAEAVLRFPSGYIANHSEDLQVVRYPVLGHYGCHYDTPGPDYEAHGAPLRLGGRMSTFTVFLNDVWEGGELIFPGALLDKTVEWGPGEWESLMDRCGATAVCAASDGLRISAIKGDVVFWYNIWPRFVKMKRKKDKHLPTKAFVAGHVHCGNEVRQGEKWIANLWTHDPTWKKPRTKGKHLTRKTEL